MDGKVRSDPSQDPSKVVLWVSAKLIRQEKLQNRQHSTTGGHRSWERYCSALRLAVKLQYSGQGGGSKGTVQCERRGAERDPQTGLTEATMQQEQGAGQVDSCCVIS